jgi:hypothetical protein
MDKFRTYSTTASSGGGSSTTSGGGGGTTTTSTTRSVNVSLGFGAKLTTTSNYTLLAVASADGSVGMHEHVVSESPHDHDITSVSGLSTDGHGHDVTIPDHTHGVSTPDHTHGLNFGIMETPITNYAIDVYIDGTLRVSIANDIANIQGIVDLTEWVTTVGWHTIELRSTTLKRISAQINIKSYIRS